MCVLIWLFWFFFCCQCDHMTAHSWTHIKTFVTAPICVCECVCVCVCAPEKHHQFQMISTSDCKTFRVLKSIWLRPQWQLEHFKDSKTSSETPGLLSKTFPDVEHFRQEVFRSVYVKHLFLIVCEAMLPPAGYVTSCDQWTPGKYLKNHLFIITKLFLMTGCFAACIQVLVKSLIHIFICMYILWVSWSSQTQFLSEWW